MPNSILLCRTEFHGCILIQASPLTEHSDSHIRTILNDDVHIDPRSQGTLVMVSERIDTFETRSQDI